MTASSIGEETTMTTGYDETGTSKTHLWTTAPFSG
jgi:hypothetical protein